MEDFESGHTRQTTDGVTTGSDALHVVNNTKTVYYEHVMGVGRVSRIHVKVLSVPDD